MKTHATLKYARIAPRKVRLLADLIRGLPVSRAEAELMHSPKRASVAILKLLRSAIANARVQGKEEGRLVIKGVTVDGGPMLKRWRARARGSAGQIQKKTSHVTITLEEGKEATKTFFIIRPEKEKEGAETKGGEAKREQATEPKKEARATKEIDARVSDKGEKKSSFFRRKSV